MNYLGDCARVYAPTGKLAHLVPPGENAGASWPHAPAVLCARPAPAYGAWLGTGSQQEYEKAALLPLCSRCQHLAVSR